MLMLASVRTRLMGKLPGIPVKNVAHISSASLWGTLDVPAVSEFLTDNPLPNGRPWGLFDSQTNYYEEVPDTGEVRPYNFTISNGLIAPDGYERPVLLVNGAFPGPLIEANWGDIIEVTVTNNITEPLEGLAIHWHGLFHKGAPWEDGAPAITQCPIAPEQTYTYRFRAAPYGTTWYHSHYSGQYAGGLIGPLIIHGPHDEYDQTIDLGPVMLTDWYHKDYYSLVEQTMSNATNATAVRADNNLINGKNNFNCSSLLANDTTPCVSDAGISKFNFKRGNKYMLRLINAGAEGLQRFSIDGHMLKVVSNDMVDVEPYMTEVVTLGIGQRSNVIVEANGELDAYWMRSSVSTGRCGLNSNPNALAAVYYDDTDTSIEPESEPWELENGGHCTNDDLELTIPLKPMALPEPDLTFFFDANITKNATGHNLWYFDQVAFMGNYNSPTLLWGILGNETFPNDPQWNVRNVGKAKSVRVVVNNLSGAG
jgi:FtsP/CotA-like multicopper oxidase with cupredoxin domain